ncbi:MAG TPA: hypothetical protein VF881_00265 [Polyangiaceae bacterium]
MSAATAGVTWWRCLRCGQFESKRLGDVVAHAPSVAPAPATPKAAPPRAAAAAPRAIAPPAAAAPTTSAAPTTPLAPEIDGCGVCSSPDVTYVVTTDVTGMLIRAAFCSVECLAQKFGLVRAPPAGGG